jgi:hypothetical protein
MLQGQAQPLVAASPLGASAVFAAIAGTVG